MATTFAELEARIRGVEVRADRAEEDITAIITTVVETREDVKALRRVTIGLALDMKTVVEHLGLTAHTAEQIDEVLDQDQE